MAWTWGVSWGLGEPGQDDVGKRTFGRHLACGWEAFGGCAYEVLRAGCPDVILSSNMPDAQNRLTL